MARETPGIGLWQAVAAVVAAVGPALVYLLAAGVGEGAAPQAEVARNTLILACVGLVIAVLILILGRGVRTPAKGAPAEVGRHAATRQALAELAVSRSFFEQLLDSVHDAVLFVSPELAVTRANEQALALLDYQPGQLVGQSIGVLVPEGSQGFVGESGRLKAAGETVVASRGGHRLTVSFRSSTLEDHAGETQGHVLVIRNITDETRSRKQIRYLTRFDSLTRVANRMQFQHKLQQAIARAARNDMRLALLYVDLDRFKDVNDTFGHPVGDRSLEITARRIVDAMDPGTLVGRLAGDEFAVLLDALPSGDDLHPALAASARMLLDRISKEFYVERRELFVTASLGIAVCPDDADNVVDLIRNADAAMYHAKQNGGNTYGFYAPQMNADAVDRLVLKNELRHAMLRDEFEVIYQPKIDLHDGRVAGAEALLRWRHPKRGEVPPSVFIPLAEDSGLISDIGAWVLDQVCRDYAHWQTRLAWPGRVAVNLSLQQLRQKDFVSRVERIFGFGSSTRHRRLRHRVLVPELTAAVPDRHTQDRPVLRAQCGNLSGSRRPRHHDHQHGQESRHGRRGRRRGDRGAARPVAEAGMQLCPRPPLRRPGLRGRLLATFGGTASRIELPGRALYLTPIARHPV